jgi:hypothetical protein
MRQRQGARPLYGTVGLSAEKILVTSRWEFITTSGLVMKLAHLSLYELGQKFHLSGHDFR